MNTVIDDKQEFAALVLRLRLEGINDQPLMSAAAKTPRSQFTPPPYLEASYSPRTIPIECGEYMEGADLSLRILHLLELMPGQRVLDVGTGSGFSAAVMSRIVDRVVTIDRYRTLAELAAKRYTKLGISNVVVHVGDGQALGLEDGTFDRILVTAAFDELPRAFAERLVSGGKMITAIGAPAEQQMLVRLTKIGSRFEREDLFPVRFQRIIGGAALAL